MPPTPLARYRGCLLGLAAGDAVGTTLEFKPPGSFQPIADMVGGGPFNLKPGGWTDDTSMALCLAESLIECGGFDPLHQLDTYCRWERDGHLSVKGYCFDIGSTTHAALERFRADRRPDPGPTDPRSAGNGSIMRLAPVPMLYAGDPEKAAECVDACRYLAGLIVGALRGRPKSELLAPMYCPVPDLWEREPLAPKVAAVAVVGQLAGASYGEDAIPEGWRAKLAMRPLIEERADKLFELAGLGSATC